MRPHGIIGASCIVAGALLLGLGGLVPAHFRAFDRELLPALGRGTPSWGELARQAAEQGRFGTAARMAEAAATRGATAKAGTADWDHVRRALAARPSSDPWGADVEWLDRRVGGLLRTSRGGGALPTLEWVLPEEVRSALARSLGESSHPGVMALLGCRRLEKTEIFPAVGTAAGQPFDAVLLVAAALVETGRAHATLALAWERAASAAVQGAGSSGLERAMLELLSAARRLEWDSLSTVVERCEDPRTLETLTRAAGSEGQNWGSMLGVLLACDGGAGVAAYLKMHGQSGWEGLQAALGPGAGAVRALVRDGYRVHVPRWRQAVVARLGLGSVTDWLILLAGRGPNLALGVKYLLWIDGLFLVFLGLWHGRRSFLDELNRRWDPRPDYRVLVVAALTSGVLLFLTAERYLVLNKPTPDGSKKALQPILRARLRAELPKTTTKAMNEKMIAMLVAFFVIQLSIYLIGLARLRHLRGRLVDAGVKLRLLDNEETLFDAPLYMGIAGSVLALVLRLTGYEGVSLMASYSSTLFGILFCFVLKVMHVRPLRQRLILESSAHPSA